MNVERGDDHLTLLERLDLALAKRVAVRGASFDLGHPEDWDSEPFTPDCGSDSLWISRVLGLRGFELDPRDVSRVVQGLGEPLSMETQEGRLIRGMDHVLQTIRELASEGKKPDGWAAVELFRQLTAEIPRFRGNALRRDMPWDGIVSVKYSPPEEVPQLLEQLSEERHFGEESDFGDLHPVRQSIRVLWRFGRVAPFPDFNTVMAFVVMNGFLLANGYPRVMPEPGDAALLTRLIAGPPPQRLVQFESRLVDQVGA